MTVQIIPIGDAVRLLRGPEAELRRQVMLKLRRRAAYRRAVHGGYNDADVAMFGAFDVLLQAGPDDRGGPGRHQAGTR